MQSPPKTQTHPVSLEQALELLVNSRAPLPTQGPSCSQQVPLGPWPDVLLARTPDEEGMSLCMTRV